MLATNFQANQQHEFLRFCVVEKHGSGKSTIGIFHFLWFCWLVVFFVMI